MCGVVAGQDEEGRLDRGDERSRNADHEVFAPHGLTKALDIVGADVGALRAQSITPFTVNSLPEYARIGVVFADGLHHHPGDDALWRHFDLLQDIRATNAAPDDQEAVDAEVIEQAQLIGDI